MAPKIRSQTTTSSPTPRILIIGTGWSGFTLSQDLALSTLSETHEITLLSPTRTMALTPLLASASASIFDFRMAEEPIRRLSTAGKIQKYQVSVSSIDFSSKTVTCKAAVGSNGDTRSPSHDDTEFELDYDTLVLAPGSETNTFNTPGVLEHCLTMKSVQDAMTLREKILDNFELASLPTITPSSRKQLLHILIIGGGPTGVELAAEMDELVSDHLLKIYPHLNGEVSISVYDVADRMLSPFGEKLGQYAVEKFKRKGVNICLGKKILGFEERKMDVEGEGEVGFGVAVWCAGNKACSLVEELGVKKTEKGMERIVTDGYLRVLNDGGEVLEGVYALGDAAVTEGYDLPSTAEVAVQKGRWLAKHLITAEKGNEKGKFEYENKALVAYIGGKDGVVEGKSDWTGKSAWLAWRSGSLEWTRGWRRRFMIVLFWFMNKLDGREVARR